MSAAGTGSAAQVVLRLFVTGTSQRSLRARDAVESMCRCFRDGAVRVEIVDVLEQPDEAESEKILATPTLIRQVPGPPRRLVGDMAEASRVIQLLGLDGWVRRPNATEQTR
jgi:circadian clock protein KaiB